MNKISSKEIRKLWIDFFEEKQHLYVEPKSLLPKDDKSLLWINSGVATLKKYFDGSLNPPSPRLVNIQKSLRTNDIENVGLTSRHHTLFEMLGNFSIGDYFKEDAVKYGIEFLTSSDYLNIDIDKLYFTVFEEDTVAYDILINNNISKDHIVKAPRSTNFWDMGQGPCGPNCEIFFDRGEKFDPEKVGLDLIKYDYDNNERYIEIWNIVFSEFNNDGNNNYELLPRQNIDTGAGFERLVSLLQDGYTNFDSDLFLPIIKEIESMTEYNYDSENYFINDEKQTQINIAFKVIADHMRAVVFAISDGAYPSNESRGYVLRRLIRRCIIFASKLNIEENSLNKLVDVIVNEYKYFYKNLEENRNLIFDVIVNEEKQFSKTMTQGQARIKKLIEENNTISAKDAFVLYDTFGFPFEILSEIALESNIVISHDDFEKELDIQKQKSRSSANNEKGMQKQAKTFTELNFESKFVGYDTLKTSSEILSIFDNDNFYDSVQKGDKYFVVFDKTPFYATKGGQVNDTGTITVDNKLIGNIVNVIVGPNSEHIHEVEFLEEVNTDVIVNLEVDTKKRHNISSNHSSTHLVHKVLFDKLGDNLKQAGSYQDAEKSRFDFSVFADFDKNELTSFVEKEVNELILKNIEITTNEIRYEDAKKIDGVFAEFEANYDDLVRVVSIGDYSYELCGGTHVSNTSDIEKIFVRNISSKGSNIYRIEFITGNSFIEKEFVQIKKNLVDSISKIQNDDSKELIKLINSTDNLNNEEITKINEKISKLKKDFKKNKNKKTDVDANSINKVNYNDIDIFINVFENNDINNLRSISDMIKSSSDKFINIILNTGKKNTIIVTSSDDIEAKKVFDNLSTILECRGGGKPTMIQGSFVNIASNEEILNKVKEVL